MPHFGLRRLQAFLASILVNQVTAAVANTAAAVCSLNPSSAEAMAKPVAKKLNEIRSHPIDIAFGEVFWGTNRKPDQGLKGLLDFSDDSLSIVNCHASEDSFDEGDSCRSFSSVTTISSSSSLPELETFSATPMVKPVDFPTTNASCSFFKVSNRVYIYQDCSVYV